MYSTVENNARFLLSVLPYSTALLLYHTYLFGLRLLLYVVKPKEARKEMVKRKRLTHDPNQLDFFT